MIINEVFQRAQFAKRKIICKFQCEEFIFSVEDLALNLLFLIIKKTLIETRTYKRKVSFNSIENELLKRICDERIIMNSSKFKKKEGKIQS